jgi:hypothetical protein
MGKDCRPGASSHGLSAMADSRNRAGQVLKLQQLINISCGRMNSRAAAEQARAGRRVAADGEVLKTKKGSVNRSPDWESRPCDAETGYILPLN